MQLRKCCARLNVEVISFLKSISYKSSALEWGSIEHQSNISFIQIVQGADLSLQGADLSV